MIEKIRKEKIVEAIGKELPNMDEAGKTYLMGFLEGFAAGIGADKPEQKRNPA